MTKCNIECEWLRVRRVVINPDGQVLPCCFFANALYVSKVLGYPKEYKRKGPKPLEYELMDYNAYAIKAPNTNMLREYIEVADELNIFKNPINEILEHEWFDQLTESWDDSDKVSSVCIRHCTINK